MARFGFLNSLAQTLCKLTAPGVPDIYQGQELWDDSLVDPDNRRPVDYALRRRLLADVRGWRTSEDLQAGLAKLEDGRCKLYVTFKALEFRRANEALFREGTYLPLTVAGENAQHVLAYARKLAENSDARAHDRDPNEVFPGRFAIVILPRLSARLLGSSAGLPLGADVWGDTRVEIPSRLHVSETATLRNVIAGSAVAISHDEDGKYLRLASVLSTFPVAMLTQS
jgi:(1->4)-alpha-D-glucan 1-alpha-D-glucosylmutase